MMKRLLFLCCLSLLWCQQMNAQCQIFNFNVNSTNFFCGDELGTICVEFFADNIFPYFDCEDHVFHLSYPTGSFIYTDLGDYVLHSQTGGITTLEYDPDIFFDIQITGCVEGVIQVPGTVFTIEVFDPNPPNTVVNSTTFAIDNFTTVGSPGTTSLVSDMVSMGFLLDPAIAATTAQNLVIEGQLVFDIDYTFGGAVNEIAMAAGAGFDIQTGVTLGIYQTEMHACDAPWDRINIQDGATLELFTSTVSGATVAVEMQDGSTFDMGNVFLDKNQTGVGSFGPNLKSINLNVFSSVWAQSSVRDSDVGFHFQNVDHIDLIAYLSFWDNGHGIILENTNLNAEYLYFSGCERGLEVREASDLLSMNWCSFYDGEVGLLSYGNDEMLLTNCAFGEYQYGVARATADVNEHTLIEEGNLYNCTVNVLAFVLPSRAELQFSQFRGDVYNVAILGMGEGKHRWAVQHNDQLKIDPEASFGINVFYGAVDDGRIFMNTDEVISGDQNFYISGGQRCKVGYNDAVSENLNVTVSNSPQALVYCNELEGDRAINIINDCSGSRINGNIMTGTGINLEYGSASNTFAVTGPQAYQGNNFDPSSEGTIKARHRSSASIALQSQYRLGFLAGAQGTALYPFFDSDANNWFFKDNQGIDLFCPSIEFEVDATELLTDLAKTNINLLAGGIKDVYGPELEFDLQLKLYRALDELRETVVLEPELQGWYDRLRVTSIGDFIEFEDVFRTATELSETEERTAVALTAAIKTLTTELNAIQWYQIDRSTRLPIIDEAQQKIFIDKSNELEIKVAELSAFNDRQSQALIGALPQLAAINARIAGTRNSSEANLKEANSLFLQRMTPGFSGFNPTELEKLKDIAGQCAGYGGEGVYLARTLFSEATLTVTTYNDECLQEVAPGRSDLETKPSLAQQVEVFPNPADESVWVNVSADHEVKFLILSDILGKTVRSIQVPEGANTFQINTSELPAGSYFLSAAEGAYEAIKLVITH
ncbi:MAG: T9SS type A sorting domain-containing protein [Bacteroidota bacterium]